MKIFKSRCYNGGNKHKYKAVYEERESPWVERLKSAKSLLRSVMFENIYMKHICIWCGSEVQRKHQ
jgi:hypothetical protein